MELLYLTDISQVNYIFDNSLDYFEKYTPLSGDLVVSSKLEKLGISFIDEWDYLAKEYINLNWQNSLTLSKKWCKELKIEEIKYNNVLLSKCTQQDFAYSFEAALNARTAYEKILNEFDVTRIFGFFLPDTPVIRTGPAPTHRAVRSVSQSVLFWLAENKNIPIIKLKSNYDLSSAISRKRKNQLNTNNVTKSKIETKKKIAFLFLDCLHKDEIIEIKNTYKNSPEWIIIPFSNNITDNIHIQIDELEDNLAESYQLFKKASAEYLGEYPEIFGNHFFHFQFQGIWLEMKKAGHLVKIFDFFFQVLKPQVLFFGYDAFTLESALIELSKKYNISTVSMLHSGLGHYFSYVGMTGNSDHILVWNQWDRKILINYGIDENRIEVLGSIRYEKLYQNLKSENIFTLDEKRKSICIKLGLNPDKPVVLLLTTAINTGFSVPVSNPRAHRRGLDEIIKYVEKRLDLQFIIKPHPSFDYYELYRNLLDSNISNLFFIEQVDFDEVVSISDVSLLINYFTTAALESLIYKIPVIFYNNAVYDLNDWVISINELGIQKVNCVLKLEKEIDKLIKTKRENSFLDNSIIKKVIGVSEKISTKKFKQIIEKITNNKRKVILNDILFCNLLKVNYKNLPINFSFDNFLYIISYTHGGLKMGVGQLFKKYASINDKPFIEKSFAKLNFLILPYIYSSRNNSITNDWVSAIKIAVFILINPKGFLKLSIENKIRVKEFIYYNLYINIKLRFIFLHIFI